MSIFQKSVEELPYDLSDPRNLKRAPGTQEPVKEFDYESLVPSPAYENNGPKVLVDAAHCNFHTTTAISLFLSF